MHASPIFRSLAHAFQIPIVSSSRTARQLLGHSCHNALKSPSIKQTAPFSSTSALLKRQKGKPQIDKRVTLIRFFLYHPLTPRPLRFSRTRYLRHWTIHRAWQLYQAKQRAARTRELERMWNAMRAACEELRTGAGDGGRLFRVAMQKKGVFGRREDGQGVPIEYARSMSEWPSKAGWEADWKRGAV